MKRQKALLNVKASLKGGAEESAAATEPAHEKTMTVGGGSPRVISIVGMVVADTAERVAQQLAQLTSESHAPILVQIFSSGGSVYAGWCLHDLLMTCGVPIITVGYSYVGSSATIVFQAGVKRFLTSNTTLMVHRIRNSVENQTFEADGFRKEANDLDRMQRSIERLFVKRTGLSPARIRAMCRTETELSATAAVKAGFADKVIRGRPLPKPPKRRR